MTLFFGRCKDWSEDDGWETVEASSLEDAAQKFAAKWDFEDDEKFLVAPAASAPQEFFVKKSLTVERAAPSDSSDNDGSPDSQR